MFLKIDLNLKLWPFRYNKKPVRREGIETIKKNFTYLCSHLLVTFYNTANCFQNYRFLFKKKVYKKTILTGNLTEASAAF